MNRISISKNLTKKISIFFLLFFIFVSFFNSSKAQNVNPSDLKLYSYTISGGGMYSTSQTITSSFKEMIVVYENTTQHTSGSSDIRAGAYNTNIKNLTVEINSLPSQFDSSFATIIKNSGNLGVSSDNTNTIIATFLFKKLIGDEVNKITKLKAATTNSDEKNIESDILQEMNSDLSSYTDSIDNTGTMTAYNYKYQINSDGTKIVNTTNISAASSGGLGSGNRSSYQDIVDQIISAIDNKATDSASQKNPDILGLKNTVTSSVSIFNDTLQKIQNSLNNSAGVAITPDQQIFLAKIQTLTPIDNIINNYISDTNNQKPGNDKIINAYNSAKTVLENYLKDASSTINDAKIDYNSTTNTITQNNKADCDSQGFWKTAFSVNANCSIGAYLINIMIVGINALVNIVVNLAGSLFDWIYDLGVIHFNDWVVGSGAYTIYKTIILSLIVSVMTFLVFYLIIRRLIDDDGENMNKILPRLILTALFVYFSFTITGWIIDQSNIITIYLYRSMTHQTGAVQTIGQVFKRILSLDNGGANSGGTGIAGNFGISLGSWNAIPFTVGQLVVSIVGVFVLFEGAILILSRTIILLLCMIFSPIMLLPDGLTEFTDKYKKLVMDNFTGNVMLGPVFMFLVLLAVQIGQATTKWMTSNGPSFDSAGVAVPTNFLGGIISSVLVIVVLQLAISASKSLSGSMGEKISGVVGKYAGKVGGLAFNTGKFVGGRALGGVMNNTQAGEKINNWITKGAGKTGIGGSLLRGVQNYTTKYGLDGETKRKSEAEEIANTHHKANEHTKLRIRTDLEKRAGNGDKTAKIALEQIDKKIEEKKNTEFKQSKDTRERETYEAEQKNKNSGGNSAGAAPVIENTKPTNPTSQNSAAEQIPKENTNRGIQLHNSIPVETGKENGEQKNNDLVKHEYPVNNFTTGNRDTASDNQNNGSGNQTIHTDNLQVVADNIQLVTGSRMIDKAKENNTRNINEPKGFISNGGEQNNIKPKLTVITPKPNERSSFNVNEKGKLVDTKKTNQDVEDIDFEEVATNK